MGLPRREKRKPQSFANRDERNKDDKKMMVITEICPKIQTLDLKGKIMQVPVKFTLDTGAGENFISADLVENMRIETLQENTSYKVTIGDGSEIVIKRHCELELSMDMIPNVEYKESFKVIEEAKNTIILGLRFLTRQKVIIDLKNLRLIIADRVIDICPEMKEKWDSNPDSRICGKILKIEENNFLENKNKFKHYKELAEKALTRFVTGSNQLGSIPNEKISIHLADKEPIVSKPYPIPFKLYPAIQEEIAKLLQLGIIRRSNSEYSSPAFPIKKKNGKIRLVVDYRKLNRKTIKESFPFPNILEEIMNIPPSNFFSKLDLRMGYHQVEMSEESIKYSSFVIPSGQYEYLRLPFGLTNAPRQFQRIMLKIFKDIPYVKVFLDDILIFSSSEEEHYNHIQETLFILAKNNVAIQTEKCSLFMNELTYLGIKLNSQGYKADLSSLEKITNLPIPRTRKQVERILGHINWFRPFLPDLSTQLTSITNKLKKEIPFQWTASDTEKVKEIFDKLKENITLQAPSFEKDFYLETDASQTGLGGVLYQTHGIIGLYSKKFSLSQKNYTVSEKECLAVIESIKHWQKIIYGNKIIIKTDHANLLKQPPIENSRIQRWKLLLEEFDYEIVHKKGADNCIADGLSRLHKLETKKKEDAFYNLEELSKAQKKEKEKTQRDMQKAT